MSKASKESDFSNLKNNAQHNVENIKEAGKEAAQEVGDNVRGMVNEAGVKIRQLYENASDGVSNATDKVTSEIRNNPIQSSVVALSVGVLLGLLLRR